MNDDKLSYWILRQQGIKLYNQIYALSMEFITTKNKNLLDKIKDLKKNKFYRFAFNGEVKNLLAEKTKKNIPGYTFRYKGINYYIYEKNGY